MWELISVCLPPSAERNRRISQQDWWSSRRGIFRWESSRSSNAKWQGRIFFEMEGILIGRQHMGAGREFGLPRFDSSIRRTKKEQSCRKWYAKKFVCHLGGWRNDFQTIFVLLLQQKTTRKNERQPPQLNKTKPQRQKRKHPMRKKQWDSIEVCNRKKYWVSWCCFKSPTIGPNVISYCLKKKN